MLRWARLTPALVGLGLFLLPGTALFAGPGLPMSETFQYRLGEEDRQDVQFVQDAVRGGMTEIELGEIAMRQGSTEAIRAHARQVVDEHRTASKELATIAKRKGIDPPTKVTSSQRRTIERLSGLSGTEFDRAYLAEQVRSHDKSIEVYERQADYGSEGELKVWASKMLPTLRNHRRMALDLSGMRAPGAAASSSERR